MGKKLTLPLEKARNFGRDFLYVSLNKYNFQVVKRMRSSFFVMMVCYFRCHVTVN